MRDLTLPGMEDESGADIVNLGERRAALLGRVQDLADQYAVPENTERAYRLDRQDYEDWCAAYAFTPWPAQVPMLVAYASDPIRLHPDTGEPYELRADTVRRRLSAISVWHRENGIEPSPTRDLRVTHAVKTLAARQAESALFDHRRAAPLTLELLRDIVERLDRTRLIDVRNRAVLLVCFWGALRRSELVRLDVDDLIEAPEGLELRLRRTKADQTGEKDEPVPVPYKSHEQLCPVRAWQAWRSAAGLIGNGPAFRSINRHNQLLPGRLPDNRVSRIVKEAVALVGEDPERFSGHSPRAGLITTAAKQRVPTWLIMRHTRHKTERVMHGYIRVATRWEENAAAMIGT
jgi:integrase